MSDKGMLEIGVIGLGAMGAGVARNLARAGFALTVFDVSEEARKEFAVEGIAVVDSVAELGAMAKVVLLSLPGPAEIEEVCIGLGGLIGAMEAGGMVIDLSTNSRQTILRVAETLAASGIGFLEAPVSGGPWGARDGTLAIWAGGDADLFDRAKPVFAAIASNVFHMGALGTGTATKLVHNIGATIRSVLVSEMLVFGVAQGIDPLHLFAAVREGSNGRARTFDLLGFKHLDRSFESPAFRLRHARKDMRIAVDTAEEKELYMPMTELCLALLDAGMESDMGDLDSTAIAKLIEARSGVTVPSSTRAEIEEVLNSHRDGRLT